MVSCSALKNLFTNINARDQGPGMVVKLRMYSFVEKFFRIHLRHIKRFNDVYNY